MVHSCLALCREWTIIIFHIGVNGRTSILHTTLTDSYSLLIRTERAALFCFTTDHNRLNPWHKHTKLALDSPASVTSVTLYKANGSRGCPPEMSP